MTRDTFYAVCDEAIPHSTLSIKYVLSAPGGFHRAVAIYLESTLGFRSRGDYVHRRYISACRAESAEAVAGKYRAWLVCWKADRTQPKEPS